MLELVEQCAKPDLALEAFERRHGAPQIAEVRAHGVFDFGPLYFDGDVAAIVQRGPMHLGE